MVAGGYLLLRGWAEVKGDSGVLSACSLGALELVCVCRSIMSERGASIYARREPLFLEFDKSMLLIWALGSH